MDQLKSAEDLNPSFHDTKDLQNLDDLVSDPVEKKYNTSVRERNKNRQRITIARKV